MANGTGMNLALALLAPVAGGLAASVADDSLADNYDIVLGKDELVPGSGVALTPGLLGAAALTLALAAGVKLPGADALKLIAAGALTVELVDLGRKHVLPEIQKMMHQGAGAPSTTPPGKMPAGAPAATKGLPAYYARTGCAPGMTDWELAQAFQQYEAA